MVVAKTNTYVVYWQRTENHKRQKNEKLKLSFHDTKEEGLQFIHQYYASIPGSPYPTSYHLAVEGPTYIKCMLLEESELQSRIFTGNEHFQTQS